MGKVKIVTDSTSDIPQDVREQYGIGMVPLKVHFGHDAYLDSVTIQVSEFYEKLAAANALPTTSQPSPAEFMELYQQIGAEPETEIISIHLSSALSGTYQSAMLAKSLLEEKIDVTVIDSKTASYGIGTMVVEAAKMAQQGKSKEEILAEIGRIRETMRIYFLVDTLEYLQKGGRIGKAAALIGSLLNIKPILSIDNDGEVASVDKVRGHKKALGRILEMLKQEFGGKPIHVTIGHANSLSGADELNELIRSHFEVVSMSYMEIGPVIGAHVGAGTTAVFMRPSET